MGTSAAGEPLIFFIILNMIYDLLIVLSFLMTVAFEMTTSMIYFMIYLIYITNIDKIC